MKKINIGENIDNNKSVEINLNNLITTRLLIQANSGGGKSWLGRKIMEETNGKVQQIIIDLEGEYSTLREKYDYLLVGNEGEVPISVKTSELLARKLLELNVSTIIDLSELKKHERILFVKKFLQSLVDCPKKLWHPVLIFIDEAHQFAPEGKSGSAESKSAVIDLMTRGRKRGFCGVLMTQRISKLDKDACAECNNRLIGRTGLDVDRKRASDELGFNSKEQNISLRNLKPGEFYAFGSSISNKVIKLKIGEVKTSHPEIGKNIKLSKTPKNIKKYLKNLIDLPKDVDEELKTFQDYKSKINDLKIELRKKKVITEIKVQKIVDVKQLEQERQTSYNLASKDFKKIINVLNNQIKEMVDNFGKIGYISQKAINIKLDSIKLQKPKFEIGKGMIPTKIIEKIIDNKTKKLNDFPHTNKHLFDESENKKQFNKCSKKVYSFIYSNQNKNFTKTQIAIMTGYSPTSSGFINAISMLNINNLIRKEGKFIILDETNLNEDIIENSDNYSVELIKKILKKCPLEIFNILLENSLESYTKEELAEETPSNYSPTSSGFINAISKLNTLGFIEKIGNSIKLNDEVLELI